ncbi:hypothetical protein PF005_g874 [Phytophthora fragariae]|uniref:UBC core domain-containing protein n=1 Tax=Phytophthora fragariae TaxID=53985 RepID=A0A6A3ZHH9_9STRA|nr:hypothetical protein PF003_g20475 [Phytophthora fragariae]KAE8949925.1 hypothetical protein PF009_g568 [Phytophthora fragariae]KAE9138578.1 hypothetical protein PF010_g925 [Phytophthora fragariae]KAE9140721.1 hypothetical protein PF007_g567 [Phytophthora fragariae]KAE9155290.1 hypothetical protein PF006_g762 [Phytophthora fragariae]
MAASVRNTAIKRIQGDVREMMTNPSDQYAAAPLETNMFDWHFTLRGPRNTEFEGGIYHGRIILPSDYPFKPPNIMLLTPNGRFEVKKKICLSISAYHPEEWQPAWGVRLILEALISFMPTKGEGAIGALDFPAEERKRLAKLSVDYKCETCGRVADLLPEVETENGGEAEKKPSKYAEQIAQLHMHNLESAPPASAATDSKEAPKASSAAGSGDDSEKVRVSAAAATAGATAVESKPASTEDASTTEPSSSTESVNPAPSSPATASAPAAALEEAEAPVVNEPQLDADTPIIVDGMHQVRESGSVDTFLHYLTVAIVVALFALIYKKLLQMHGVLQ